MTVVACMGFLSGIETPLLFGSSNPHAREGPVSTVTLMASFFQMAPAWAARFHYRSGRLYISPMPTGRARPALWGWHPLFFESHAVPGPTWNTVDVIRGSKRVVGLKPKEYKRVIMPAIHPFASTETWGCGIRRWESDGARRWNGMEWNETLLLFVPPHNQMPLSNDWIGTIIGREFLSLQVL